jgi:hypothetical protein
MAVLMAITSPLVFNNGPPEFPGLIGASVWIISGIEYVEGDWTVGAISSGMVGLSGIDGIILPSPLMIPSVIEPDNP